MFSYEPGTQETLTMGEHLTKHGDGAKDVAFTVEDLDAIMERYILYPSVLDFWKIEFETFSKNQGGRTWFLVYFELQGIS